MLQIMRNTTCSLLDAEDNLSHLSLHLHCTERSVLHFPKADKVNLVFFSFSSPIVFETVPQNATDYSLRIIFSVMCISCLMVVSRW